VPKHGVNLKKAITAFSDAAVVGMQIVFFQSEDCRVKHGFLEIRTRCLAYQFFSAVLAGHDISVLLGDDQQSGLLIRTLRYVQTPLGRNPAQIDYGDYREEGGVKTPFHWTIARPDASFTIQIEQTQQAAPIADDKFAKPASTPPAS
jgi:hypothetical protein